MSKTTFIFGVGNEGDLKIPLMSFGEFQQAVDFVEKTLELKKRTFEFSSTNSNEDFDYTIPCDFSESPKCELLLKSYYNESLEYITIEEVENGKPLIRWNF